MHYSNFYHLAKKLDSRTMVSPVIWFTHYDPNKEITIKQLVNQCVKYNAIVLCPCSSNEKILIENGMPPERIKTILGGFDNDLLSVEGPRLKKEVSFVSACYDRKRPDLLLSVIEKMNDYHFNIVGPHPDDVDNKDLLWSRSKYNDKLQSLPNVTLHEVRYEDYSSIMVQSSIYLMLSDFEGGPIGLIEAMALDLIPICTNTGFVQDLLIEKAKKGIIPVDPDAELIIDTIKRVKYDFSSRDLVRDFDWSTFSKEAVKFIFKEQSSFIDELKNVKKPIYYVISKELELKESKDYKGILSVLKKVNSYTSLDPIERNIIRLKMSHYESRIQDEAI
ncbi:glycosyltransferase [Vibrio rotiferianus]|uniref:glycosyltransferase n=1 Tax=Vibrio rotiferianus TaxID=190895 RepID=UPI0015F35FF8|nr:glycosyltransferase [Vibrio rotiferianus]